ncbi:lantibiotic dehydratase family protein [Cloacibacterium normanense]|uniref:lantibiotic dehydratase family protein n=1 Tax=Cloacibacterium normanense TaxID=237258 RepID=UPI00352E7C31
MPYKKFEKIFSNQQINHEKLEVFTDGLFREAIYLASLSLFDETKNKISEKSKVSLLKYYNRASTRYTPFGLFAGVSLGKFDKEDYFPKSFSDNERLRDTNLDMYFLVGLSQHLNSIPHIKNNILYFSNNSIYTIGKNKIRFVEYENKEGKRDYIISSAPLSEELEQILLTSSEGKTIDELSSVLIDEEISLDDAREFIDELIENQVLVSELEPNVAGNDFLDSIISILERIGAKEERDLLVAIKNKIQQLDLNFGNSENMYAEIEELINNLNIEYDKKYLFQTDLYYNSKIGLSYQWKKQLKKGISFLNKITAPYEETALEKFKEAFYERFENEEVSLSYALDSEIGIGYLQNIPTKGVHPYLEDLVLPSSKQKKELQIKLNPIHILLNQKLQKSYWDNDYVIKLSEDDFNDFEENWDDLPDTLSLIGEIISENQQEKLYINNITGKAGRLLGRFCSEKSTIKDFGKQISDKEQELNPNKILAEIIHLPESRIGNVIRRTQLRNYEIPYLANSTLEKENQISIDDLYLSIKNNRLFLRSKKHNKEVIPHLTNAHNYSNNSLPIYHFLCDYSNQKTRASLFFDWGGLSQIYDFLPRVEYENIILSKAQWKINSEQIKIFNSIILTENIEHLFQKIEAWRKLKQIPQWIQWVKGDNTLAVNLQNFDLVQMFFSSVKNEKIIIIEEFLCNDKSDYVHQFVFSLYKDL